MKVYTTDERGNFEEIGRLKWKGDGFSVETRDEEVARIVERVNNTRTWDTGAPPEGSNAPVAESDIDIDNPRATGLVRTYLLENGYALDAE